jgi:Tol biopolymer transport system component
MGLAKIDTRPTRVTRDDANDDIATWSPDGSRIAFQSVRGENYDIEVMRPDGSQRTRLSTSPAYDGQFSWSPDSKRLAFISGRDGFDGVYVVRVDGGETTRLTTRASLNPAWSR